MPRRIADSVVVITGASSGIGRATALELARHGATVVLAARREQALDDVADECEAFGARALAVRTDVTHPGAVDALAREAIEQFGRIDVWINNAAVAQVSTFEQTPLDVVRRVMETNFFGYVHGARAALRCFREQGRGVLINIDTDGGDTPQPYSGAYRASKRAARDLFETVRLELHLDRARDIHICHVVPGPVDTPLVRHAANYTGRAVRARRPRQSPARVARGIVRLIERPAREVVFGAGGRAASLVRRAAVPVLVERVSAHRAGRRLLAGEAAPESAGNLFAPLDDAPAPDGGGPSAARPARRRRRVALAGVALALPTVAFWALRRRRALAWA